MRTRQQVRIAEDVPSKTPLVSIPALLDAAVEPKKSGRGGARTGAGRKPFKPGKRKESPAYVSMTTREKAKLQAKAKKKNLTLSFYIRDQLGLPIDEPLPEELSA